MIIGARRQSISSFKLIAKKDKVRKVSYAHKEREEEKQWGGELEVRQRMMCKVLQQLPVFKDKHANGSGLHCRSIQ